MSLQLLGYKAAARVLDLPETYLRRHIKTLPHQKYGQHVKFGEQELAAIQEMHRVRPADPDAAPQVPSSLLELRPGGAPRKRRSA